MHYNIIPVEWDSKFFGFPVGRINITPGYSEEKLGESLKIGKNEFRLIYIFLKEAGPDQLDGFESPCICYDRKIIYNKDLVSHAPELDTGIRLYTESACTKRLEALAVLSGNTSRFRKDPKILPFYEQLFLTWINNSVVQGTADAIWVWQGEDKKPSGLATVRVASQFEPELNKNVKEARIGMLAVEERYRTRNIERKLVDACEYWSISLGLDRSTLVVSADEEEELALCKNAKYTPGTELSVYHYWAPAWKYNPKWGWKCLEPSV